MGESDFDPGYEDDNSKNELIDAFKQELELTKKKNSELTTALSGVSYQGRGGEKNLIEFQLDTEAMLEKIEHFLKGDVLKVDEMGNEYWAKQKNKDLVLFNEYGVNSLMLIIGNYIDKNTVLSFYNEDRINEILADLGDELANFIFCNYEKMGMDTDFKKTRYALTVLTIVHSIESAYRRAMHGDTVQKLNSATIFTQSDHLGLTSRYGQQPQKRKFNLFNPKTW